MAANSSLTLSSLDFDTLKDNFKEFLKTQSVLKDYNYDGSNINVLLDVMAYNSYLNSFYLNMVASEMFLDSAQKYDSIVSHSKELNYTPRSAHSSVANVSFTVETTGILGNLTIPKGARFSGSNSNGSFNFVTDSRITVTSTNNIFVVDNLQIKEGIYFQDSFVMNYDIENQLFVLSNQNIDTSSLEVYVIEDNGSSNTEFTRSETLFELDNKSEVFFVQGSDNNKYEVVFGDGYFGRKPKNGATILVKYIVTNGHNGNGVEEFTLDDDIGPFNNGIATVSSITTVSPSVGGSTQESIESVRFAAPRYFATQQRAVSSDDYAALVKNNFGGEIQDVAIFGGQDVEPKRYGRVIVCIKPVIGTIAPDYLKNRIINFLLRYVALPNRLDLSDPEYMYVKLDTIVQYNIYTTSKSVSELKTEVLNAILQYSSDHLELFNKDLRFSRLAAEIDDSDTSIVSNQTYLRLVKKIAPLLNYPTTFSINTKNAITYETPTKKVYENGVLIPHAELYLATYQSHYDHASLISSKFTYRYNGVEYPEAYFADDGQAEETGDDTGKAIIKVYAPVNGIITPIVEVGKIRYSDGSFTLNNITVSSYTGEISIYLRNEDVDIFAGLNNIIKIVPEDVSITIIEAKE
jgi:hypothetical protein